MFAELTKTQFKMLKAINKEYRPVAPKDTAVVHELARLRLIHIGGWGDWEPTTKGFQVCEPAPRYYTLPNGTRTIDRKKYEATWRAFGKPLSAALGGKAVIYDAGVSINLPSGRQVHFDTEIVSLLNKALSTR